MSDKKRARRRKDEYTGPGEQKEEKPSKQEYTIAKWLRSNVKMKRTKFLQHNVEYFTGNKAVDALLESKFATGTAPLFATREAIVEYLDIMLEHKFFHRARKIPVPWETTKEVKTKEAAGKDVAKKDNEKESSTEAAAAAGAAAPAATGSNSDAEKKEKRKRRVRLEMHSEQLFADCTDAYVWIYDPIPLRYWIYGFILVLAAIVVCLFPLWPPMLRQGVYYLSLTGAGFLVFMILLSIVRLLIFMLVWAATVGGLHFWIFPNLAEDVGFFASFWPLYEATTVEEDTTQKSKSGSKKSSKSKSKKKQKDSDAEQDNDDDGNEQQQQQQQQSANSAAASVVADDKVETLESALIENIKEHDADDLVLRQRKVAATAAAGQQDDTEEDDSQHSCDNSDAGVGNSKDGSQRESDSDGTSFEIIHGEEVRSAAENVN